MSRPLLSAGRMARSQGFSLVEVMAAMVITSIFMVAIAPMFTAATNTLLRSRRTTIATTLLQQDMENLRALPLNCDLTDVPDLILAEDDRYRIVRPVPPTPDPDDENALRLLEFSYQVEFVATEGARPQALIDTWEALVWCDPPEFES